MSRKTVNGVKGGHERFADEDNCVWGLHAFDAEHNRLVGHVQGVFDANPALLARYRNDGGAAR